MRVGLYLVSLALALSASCGNESFATANLDQAELRSVPESLQPGATITLRPFFPKGVGRIEPLVGEVESGKGYVVGPFGESMRFRLVVQDGKSTSEVSLLVPFRYRERVSQVEASQIARSDHDAIQLEDGTLMVVGGRSTGPGMNIGAERYAPENSEHSAAGGLSTGRRDPKLVVAGAGDVLCIGGQSLASSLEARTVVERWSVEQNAWSVIGSLATDRSRHTVTRLEGGDVLVFGGAIVGLDPSRFSAEIWTAKGFSRALQGGSAANRMDHSATRLPDGRVLVVGGVDPATGSPMRSVELFDPETEAMVPTGSLLAARSAHAAVLLDEGRVLVIGGKDAIAALSSCEIWDAKTGVFSPGPRLQQPVYEVRALRAASGEVLVVGGQSSLRAASSAIQSWMPGSTGFRGFGVGLPSPRSGHSLTLLEDGRVLLLGGDSGADFPTSVAWRIE